MEQIDGWSVGLNMTAGLVLFIFAVTLLADALKATAEEKAKSILAKLTTNRWAAVGTGAVATTLLDSSSVTIIMVITLVNARLLTFVQSLGVVMGSNIGTTVSSQIIAFSVGEYAAIGLLTGFLMLSLPNPTKKNIGRIIFAISLIFYSLDLMGQAVSPLKDAPAFEQFIKEVENPWIGVLVGAVATALIQSSSAMMGMVIVLASQGMMTLPAGVAMMLGAEIGTCANTLIATIGRNRSAIRTGVFHLLFNIMTVLLGVLLVERLITFTEWFSDEANLERKIANAHVFFNVGGVLLFVGFLKFIARGLHWLIPDRRERGAREPA